MPEVSTHDPAPMTPLPLPVPGGTVDPSARAVILFGGTFDPPHLAHIRLARAAREHLERTHGSASAWLVAVPAGRSPHKNAGPIAPGPDRAAMLALALADVPRAGVWTDEIARVAADPRAPSFTIDTARRARAWLDAHGGAGIALRLLIGADQALALHRWREPRALLDLAPPLIMLRDGPGEPSGAGSAESLGAGLLATGAWSADERGRLATGVATAQTQDVSSTALRAALAASPRDEPALAHSLDPRVRAYIDAHGLYR